MSLERKEHLLLYRNILIFYTAYENLIMIQVKS